MDFKEKIENIVFFYFDEIKTVKNMLFWWERKTYFERDKESLE